MARCSAEHWIGHSRISGEDLFAQCVKKESHSPEYGHCDAAGATWGDEHEPYDGSSEYEDAFVSGIATPSGSGS